MEVVDAEYGLAVEFEQNVPVLNVGASSRPVWHDFGDHEGISASAPQAKDDAAVKLDCLAGDPEPAPAHAPVAHQAMRHVARGIDANREAETLRAANHCRVDADDASARVCERPPGVPGIEGSVSLNHTVDETPGGRAQSSSECANDAGRDRRVIAERIAHCDDNLPNTQVCRAAE